MSPAGRALLGFLLAPAMPNFLILLLAIFQGSGAEGVWWATLMLPASYITSVLIGAPIVMFLKKINRNGLIYYVVFGVIATLLPISYIVIYPLIKTYGFYYLFTYEATSQHKIALFMMVIGVLVSTTFWLIARPDRLAT